jgi:endoribonuclease Dicer
MRRIDDMLLVTELNAALFDHSIQEHQLHAAISTPSACAEFDYERLELLGDAYLKYLSSIYLFVTNPSQHEGALHSARLRIISNRALFLNAESIGLAPYIQAKPLVAKQWSPPNFTVIPPPPPKVRENEITAHAEDDLGRDAGLDRHTLEVQIVKQEEKGNDRVSLDPCLGSGPGLLDLDPCSVIVDDVKAEDSATLEGPVIKKDSREWDIDEGASLNEAAKPATEKSSPKRSKKDDQNLQWLGDKVIVSAMSATMPCSRSTGHSRCCRSDHRRCIHYRGKQSRSQYFKGFAHCRTKHRSMVRFCAKSSGSAPRRYYPTATRDCGGH